VVAVRLVPVITVAEQAVEGALRSHVSETAVVEGRVFQMSCSSALVILRSRSMIWSYCSSESGPAW
jgi:hypothetical protein